MNLKGCLSSAQIFNTATPPIYPILKRFPFSLSYSVLWNSARLLKTATRCLSAIIITATDIDSPNEGRISKPVMIGLANDQIGGFENTPNNWGQTLIS